MRDGRGTAESDFDEIEGTGTAIIGIEGFEGVLKISTGSIMTMYKCL